jgi:hypothetical protein
MTISLDAPSLPAGVNGMRLMPVGRELWRVLDPGGRAVGHVRTTGTGRQRRYIAQRFRPAERGFRVIGAFWTLHEAIDCLRLSR